MSKTVRTAWGYTTEIAKKLNAYHHIKENDVVINLQGETVGIATAWKARPTATTHGSVQLTNDNDEIIWISGDLIDMGNNMWVITNNTDVLYYA